MADSSLAAAIVTLPIEHGEAGRIATQWLCDVFTREAATALTKGLALPLFDASKLHLPVDALALLRPLMNRMPALIAGEGTHYSAEERAEVFETLLDAVDAAENLHSCCDWASEGAVDIILCAAGDPMADPMEQRAAQWIKSEFAQRAVDANAAPANPLQVALATRNAPVLSNLSEGELNRVWGHAARMLEGVGYYRVPENTSAPSHPLEGFVVAEFMEDSGATLGALMHLWAHPENTPTDSNSQAFSVDAFLEQSLLGCTEGETRDADEAEVKARGNTGSVSTRSSSEESFLRLQVQALQEVIVQLTALLEESKKREEKLAATVAADGRRDAEIIREADRMRSAAADLEKTVDQLRAEKEALRKQLEETTALAETYLKNYEALKTAAAPPAPAPRTPFRPPVGVPTPTPAPALPLPPPPPPPPAEKARAVIATASNASRQASKTSDETTNRVAGARSVIEAAKDRIVQNADANQHSTLISAGDLAAQRKRLRSAEQSIEKLQKTPGTPGNLMDALKAAVARKRVSIEPPSANIPNDEAWGHARASADIAMFMIHFL